MQLHKTDKARSALLERTDTLTAQDRRILILSDGRRSLDDIAGLLGPHARPAVLRLVEEHYLATSHASPSARGGALESVNGLFRGTRDPVVAQAAVSAAPATSTPAIAPIAAPPPAPNATRRSLAATKMYMLDMLQLQRDPEAAAIKATIQTSVGPDALVAAVLRGLQHIQAIANPSYGQRVFNRVAEMIPEEALPALQAQCAPASSSAG